MSCDCICDVRESLRTELGGWLLEDLLFWQQCYLCMFSFLLSAESKLKKQRAGWVE